MAFEKKVPDWKAQGSEPPESLKTSGFESGYKPPANYFNWFWHTVSEAFAELHKKVHLETYTSLSQIGLTIGSETIEDIATNIPDNSTLFANVGAENANIYPVAYGVLYVMKRDGTRTFFEFLEKTSARRYYGVYDSTMASPWSGWEKFAKHSELDAHLNSKENPHEVTKAQVGLGNVPNVSTNNQTPTYGITTELATLTSGEKLSAAFSKIKLAISTLISHIGSHKLQTYISFADIGLTIGSETIEDIATNLPDNSQLFVVVGADGAPIYPVAYGTLHVLKKNTSRTYFEFLEKTSARRYYGVYDSTMSTPWTGWGKFYSSEDKPTPADIGAATTGHKHSAADVTSGTLPIARGGTGATSAAAARTALDTVCKSGDTMSGSLNITKSGTAETAFIATNGNGSVALSASGSRGLYDNGNKKWVVQSAAGSTDWTFHGKATGLTSTLGVSGGGSGATTASAALTAFGIRRGSTPNVNVAASVVSTLAVTFSSACSTAPIVTLTVKGEHTNIDFGRVQYEVTNVTTTGFTIRAINKSDSAYNVVFNYIAVIP